MSESYFQSRNSFGTILDNAADEYEMSFEGPGYFTVKGVYQQEGLYQAQYVPTIAGDYTVHVTLLGLDI